MTEPLELETFTVDGEDIEIPRLKGWLTLAEAGDVLGVNSKQGMHRICWESREFDFANDMRAAGRRPLFLIRQSAVYELHEVRKQLGDRRHTARRTASGITVIERQWEDDELPKAA